MNSGQVTSETARRARRVTVEAFGQAVNRELHILQAADLEALPTLVFQQLYNRLQWTLPEGAARRAADEAARRAAADRPTWLHLRTRLSESESLIRTFDGHGAWVEACAVSPDGRRIVSASWDKTLKLWDLATGSCEATLAGHGDRVNACAISPDGRRIVSGSADKTLKLWDAATGSCEATLKGHDDRSTPAPSRPTGTRIVSASDDGTLRLWDAATGSCRAILEGHGLWVNACAFSPDGRRLVSGSAHGDPQALGRGDRELRGDPRGQRQPGQVLRLLSRRAHGSSRRAPTRPSSSGTRRPGAARGPWRGTATRSTPAPSLPTGAGSSPRARTRPSSSGTRRRGAVKRP